MVCFACNGKGYVKINDRELPCSECQGQGEFPSTDIEQPQAFNSTIESQVKAYERIGVRA